MKIYVQIGANVGNDDFQKLVESIEERVKIILIEPNPELLDILSNNYNNLKDKHDIIICPCGVALTNDTVNIYLYAESGHSSLLNRRTNPMRSSIEVPVVTFDFLCEKFSISEIEYLSVDTEGLDYEIINSIDISKIDIKTIVFEKWPINNDDLNGIYRTGTAFLNNVVVPKFKNYKWEDIIIGFMPSYQLTKIGE
jgi:FkbM family methyltransferase